MRLGVLLPEFPTQTHVFFWREIVALRRLGAEVWILSTRKPKEGCPHEFAREAAPQTHYLYPPRVRPVARQALQAVAPSGGAARLLRYAASLSRGSRGAALGYALCAADLADFARAHAIEHVHVHSLANAAHVAAMANLLSGLSFSLHLHGDLPVYGTDHRQKMQRAAFVAAAAQPMVEQVVAEAGVPRERVFRMIMGVDLSRFSVRPPQADNGPLHVVSISRLARGKGHGFGLAAMRRALDAGADLRYSIAGSGPDQAAIEADVVRHRLTDRVKFVGPLSERGVSELLQTADVFLLTSVGRFEASPVAVMEAMATGVPAVVSRIGGTGDMIDSGTDGILVDQEDVAGIADALGKLSADRALVRRMGLAARRRAETEFDAAVLAARFMATVTSMRVRIDGRQNRPGSS